MDTTPQRLIPPRRRRATALVLLALGLLLPACTQGYSRPQVTAYASPARLAMPSAQIARFDDSAMGLSESARFEFARRDLALNAETRGPLRATRQWPQPARPLERRIIFNQWVQY